MKAYDVVTEKILERLASGVIPWRKSWRTALPKSYGSKKEYRGINIFLLSCDGFTSRYWISYKEAERLGGHVKKGERGTPVIYWHWRTEQEIAKLIASGKTTDPAPCIPFVSTVFNLDQVEGINRPEDDVTLTTQNASDRAEAVYNQMVGKPRLVQGVTARPAYSSQFDTVTMPFTQQFHTSDHYYATLFHELIHATGHSSRLARFGNAKHQQFDDVAYSYEELIAEFGSAFLCGVTGIESNTILDDAAGYINEWSKVFRSDKTILLKAASAAQKAVDHISGVTFGEIKKVEDHQQAA